MSRMYPTYCFWTVSQKARLAPSKAFGMGYFVIVRVMIGWEPFRCQ